MIRKWTRETILEEIKLYEKISKFKINNRGGYHAMVRLGMHEEVKKFYNIKENKPLDNNSIFKEALKYSNKGKFKYGSRIHYEQAIKNEILDEACMHMESRSGFNKSKSSILYYLSVCDGKAFKIGITNRTVDKRFSLSDLGKLKVLKTWKYDCGKECYEKEQEILKKYSELKYSGDPLLENGNTELFSMDILNLNKE